MGLDWLSTQNPARYFPLEKGIYEVAPGLRTLGTPFGNGEADQRVFQLDREFGRYRENKRACRLERLNKYYITREFSPEAESRVNRFLVDRFLREYPALFQWDGDLAQGSGRLRCLLTNENLVFTSNFRLDPRSSAGDLPYASAFDAFCSQVQEDIAVMSADSSGKNWLSAIHLCSPSHWSAEEKIGRNFFEIHQPVPGIEKINQASASFVDAMIRKGPYVRFVWGFATDRRLNHHPEPAPGSDPATWKGRNFDRTVDTDGSPLWIRLERQTTFGLPEVNAAVFTIRVYFLDGREVRAHDRERKLLESAILSMTPESRVYKGLRTSIEDVIGWLNEERSGPSLGSS